MAILKWTYADGDQNSVDINKIRFIETDDNERYWNIVCDVLIYDAEVSQKLFIEDAGDCEKKVFTCDYDTGELEDTLIFVRDIDFLEYRENGSIVIVTKNKKEYAVFADLFSINFE